MGYGGGYGYGGPHMMGPPHHMGHHGGHGMGGHGRGMGGGGGMVPFRAGDWKCGNDGCGYHNFAKNVSCLRCNASRAGAAVVADASFTQPMEQPHHYGMGPPPSQMAGNPPPGAFAPPPNYGAGAFGGNSNYGGQPSYGVGAPSGPWAPMGTSAYPQQSAGNNHSGGFDRPDTQAAFASAGNNAFNHNSSSSFHGAAASHADNSTDPFAFLNSGMSNLNVSDDARRNGANSGKSPN
jgi:hypothetical protein